MALVASPILSSVVCQGTSTVCFSGELCKNRSDSTNTSEGFDRNPCQCILKSQTTSEKNNIQVPNALSNGQCHENQSRLVSDDGSECSKTEPITHNGQPSTAEFTSSLPAEVSLGTSKNPNPESTDNSMANDSRVNSIVEPMKAETNHSKSLNVTEVESDEGRLPSCVTDGSESNGTRESQLGDDRRRPPSSVDGLLPPEFFTEAEQDLHEKQEWIHRDVEALREMVLREEGLRSRTDTAFLLTFLRARKFDYEKAFAMIQGYYQSRQANQSFYAGLTVTSLQGVWEKRLQTVLPSPDRHGRTVLIFRAGAWNPNTLSLDDVFKAQVMLLEHVVRRPITQLKGIAAVVDCAGLGRTHAYNLTAAHIRRMVAVVQEVFPLRFKALHFINEPLMFEWMFSLIKPLLSDTIKKRLHFHGCNVQSLLDYIPSHELPSELGGTAIPMDNSELVQILSEQEAYFADHFSYGYTTNTRPSARSFVTRSSRRPLPRSMSVSDAGRRAQFGGANNRECADEALRADDSNSSLRGSVADVGSILGSYYRRMCID